MGIFLKWYVGRLKSHPTVTNLGSALVLMTAGDVMAQELERYKLGDAYAGSNPELEGVPDKRRLHLRQYFPHHHLLPHDEDDDDDQVDDFFPPQGPPSHLRYDGEASTSNWSVAVHIVWKALCHQFERWDGFRTGTMAVWSVGMYAPAYMCLYRIYDRILPTQTPITVLARVVFAVVYSIPVNALFFTYGTFVHHTTEWWELREDWQEELEDVQTELQIPRPSLLSSSSSYYGPAPPYDWEMMWSKARLKIHSELYTTVSNSAKMWIPINAINFAVVPPHLRPLGLMFFSVFWNCYLSLVQHRDVPLPEGV